MKRRRRQFENGTRYVVVSRPCEDMILDDNIKAPETMLIPAHEQETLTTRQRGKGPSLSSMFGDMENDECDANIAKKVMRGIRFGEDLRDEEKLVDALFAEEEDDSELDDEDIAAMMKPDPDRVFTTVLEELPPRRGYHPVHGTLERQLERALQETAHDENYDPEDARVRGFIDLANMTDAEYEAHAAALEAVEKEALKIKDEYNNERSELRDITRSYLTQHSDLLADEDAPEEPPLDIVHIPIKKKQWDCETILSTYSNLYNHPSVLSVTTAMSHSGCCDVSPLIDLNKIKRRKKLNGKGSVNAVECGEDEHSTVDTSYMYIPERKSNETPEEKLERRRAVKEMQRLKRSNKKAMKLSYRQENIRSQFISSVAAKTASGAIPL